MAITETREGVLLRVYVKTRARHFELKVEENEVTVYCTEEPAQGRVNKELIKELSKLFDRDVELASGFTSRQKLLLVRGATKVEIEQVLATLQTY